MKNRESIFPYRPWLVMAVVIISFVVLQISSSWILYDLLDLEIAVEINESRAMLSFLIISFLITPNLLHFPFTSKALVLLIEQIKLFQDRPFGNLILLAVSSYPVLALSQVAGVVVLHLSQGGALNADFYSKAFPTSGYFSIMAFILAFPPILEEVVFRGVLLTAFRSKYGPVRAVVFSSLGYALAQLLFVVDGRDPQFIFMEIASAFLISIFYCVLYLRAGSLLPNMIFHYLNGLLTPYLTSYLSMITVAAKTKVMVEVLFINGLIPVMLMVPWVLLISSQIEEKREQSKTNMLDRLEKLRRED